MKRQAQGSLEATSFKRKKVVKEKTADALTEWDMKQDPEQEEKKLDPSQILTPEQLEAKKAKEKAKKKERRKKLRQKHMERKGGWEDVSYLGADHQSAFWWTKLAESIGKTLTPEQLANEIADECFSPLPVINANTKFNMHYLVDYLPRFMPNLVDTNTVVKGNGAPMVLILCSSALRVIAVSKALYDFGPHVQVAGKLFAKHQSVDDQTKMLKSTNIRMAVGTPDRVDKLIENGSLSLKNCRYLIIDMEKNVKGFHILDLAETKKSVFLLYWKYFHNAVAIEKKTQIILF